MVHGRGWVGVSQLVHGTGNKWSTVWSRQVGSGGPWLRSVRWSMVWEESCGPWFRVVRWSMVWREGQGSGSPWLREIRSDGPGDKMV